MTFYIKDYALYTETEKNSPILSSIGHDPLVHITLGGGEQSYNHLEIVGEAGLVADRGVDDWLRQDKGVLAVAADMVILGLWRLR